MEALSKDLWVFIETDEDVYKRQVWYLPMIC